MFVCFFFFNLLFQIKSPIKWAQMDSHYLLLSEDYLIELFAKFEKMRNSLSLCDITIRIDDKVFHAHRVVLAASSAYFEAMFTSGHGRVEKFRSKA